MTYIALDRLNWRPGWQETPALELKTLVQEAMDRNPRGWVVDGNYKSKIGTLVEDQTTDIICECFGADWQMDVLLTIHDRA